MAAGPARVFQRPRWLSHSRRACRAPGTRTTSVGELQSWGGVWQDRRPLEERQTVPPEERGTALGSEPHELFGSEHFFALCLWATPAVSGVRPSVPGVF
ncbi:hypothetical protein NDU88_004317 [Pleurodeles waltl]|uniref:Uncharacterized protein n=1 Tax=Pleurodeles waltl TaxID=8319 RepID=A0AAV7LUA3_PLEWA|nr:hypothetical protein NDU88_004317 [Pleurodeles waltl]